MDALFVVDIVVAMVLGTLIGLERQWRQHQAGLRTNALVALGAASFVSLSRLMHDQESPTRIAAYIVSGLGFLGGGVILRDGLTVKGMNTAATLWCTEAIGTLAGGGWLLEAVIATGAVLMVHLCLRPVVRSIESRTRTTTDVETFYRLRAACADGAAAQIRAILMRHIGASSRMSVQGIATEDGNKASTVILAEIYAVEKNDRALEDIVARLSIEPDVTGVSWQRTAG